MNISGLVEDSILLVQVAELLSGGGVSRPLLNKTIIVNIPLVSNQESSKCRQLILVTVKIMSLLNGHACELGTLYIDS